MAIARFALNGSSTVVEIASNDGYLLQNFAKAGIPVLGIEPARNVAKTAIEKGVPTEIAFFGKDTARRIAASGRHADLLAAKNVLAHVPDINDFVAGIPELLKPEGVFTVEFPHLLNLIQYVQFDTIYHEHFTYLSLLTVAGIFARHGLRIFDVEEVETHGGSLRVFACHKKASHPTTENVERVVSIESAAKLDSLEGYEGFGSKVEGVRTQLVSFIAQARSSGGVVAGYGAAAKGNTLLNYCGLGQNELAFVCDRNPSKQNTLLPGSRIPVFSPEQIMMEKPNYILILPWNIKDEIVDQLSFARQWGAKFVTAIPRIQISD